MLGIGIRRLESNLLAYALVISVISTGLAIFASPQVLTQKAFGALLSSIDGSSCAPDFGGTWDGGTNTCTLPGLAIDNGDGVEIPAGVTVILPAGKAIIVNDGALIVVGTLNVNGFIDLDGSPSTLNINSGGTLNVNSGGRLDVGGDGIAVANLGGTLNVKDGGTVNNIVGSTINVLSTGTLLTFGSGVVNADGGTFNVNSGGNFGGTLTFTDHESTTINAVITTDTLTINSFSEVRGTIDINNGGTINLVGSIETPGSINVNSGGTLNVNGFLYLTGSPSTLNVNSGGKLNVNSGGRLDVGGDGIAVANLGGTLNVKDGGRLDVNLGSTINVLSTGTLLTLGSGVVNDDGGTLNVNNGGSLGGTLNLQGSDPTTINAVITTDTLAITGFSEVVGTIDINNGGTINLVGSVETSGSIKVNSGGILNVNGFLYLNGSPSTLNVNLGGKLNVNSGGRLDVGGDGLGTLNVNSGGTVNVNSDGTLDVNSFSQATVLCGGIFNNNGGTVTGTITYEGDCTPSKATNNLIGNINAQVTDKNVKSSLLAPLKEVQKILNDSNPGNDGAACDKLSNFISNVNSKEASGKLSSALAQQYKDAANAIKLSLGC